MHKMCQKIKFIPIWTPAWPTWTEITSLIFQWFGSLDQLYAFVKSRRGRMRKKSSPGAILAHCLLNVAKEPPPNG